jgi:hypothetical protein
MGIAFSDTLRSARAQKIIDAIDAGTGPGTMLFYTSPQPAKGAAITTQTLLGTVTFDAPTRTATPPGCACSTAMACSWRI